MSTSLQLQHITLRVPDLSRSVNFYTQLGFVTIRRDGSTAELAPSSDSAPILGLSESREALPASRDAAGLFHAALLFPDRPALGRWLRSAAQHGVEFDGFSDHGVSEAIYFSDPDGNGLEFYVDRPRDQWPSKQGELEMVTKPLDIAGLLATATGPSSGPLLSGAAWGHLHLRVTNLDRSEQFYGPALGMVVTQRSYPGARFLAADGYHHHLGLNIWGHPRQPQPPGALGLASATFAHRGTNTAAELRDPDGIGIRVVPL